LQFLIGHQKLLIHLKFYKSVCYNNRDIYVQKWLKILLGRQNLTTPRSQKSA